jgi:hypothetical protein
MNDKLNGNGEEDDFEDSYVTFNFPDFNDTNFLLDKTLILDDVLVAPRCVIDGYEFKGSYELSLGTQLVFAEETNNYELIACTTKSINFKLSRIGKIKDTTTNKKVASLNTAPVENHPSKDR